MTAYTKILYSGLLFGIGLLLNLPLAAVEPLVVAGSTTGTAEVRITGVVRSDGAILDSYTLSGSQLFDISFELQVAPQDIGLQSSIYLVGRYNNQLYVNHGGNWQKYEQGQSPTLPAYQQKQLESLERIEIKNIRGLPAGEYLFYAGYKNALGEIVYNAQGLGFVVFDEKNPALHQVNSDDFLTSYLNRAAQNRSTNTAVIMAADVAFAAADSSSSEAVSTTNLQEQGVDEGDIIKVVDDRLFVLSDCGSQAFEQTGVISGTSRMACLYAYQMQQQPAATKRLGQQQLEQSMADGELYLYQDNNDKDQLIVLSTTFDAAIWDVWYETNYWSNQRTDITMMDVSDPQQMRQIHKISIEGAKISSRMVGDTLYVLSRYGAASPVYTFEDIAIPSLSAVSPSGTADILELEQLLPQISIDSQQAQMLVEPQNCYLPLQQQSPYLDQTLISLTAIPVQDPDNFQSICLAGSIDTFYMSSQALYLANSQTAYEIQGNDIVYAKDTQYLTNIHKFSYSGTQLRYRGSAQVVGHLGWEIDKRSFRFGENNGVLKVATSLGQTWDSSSTTRVGVFKEHPQQQILEEISYLENLGKPGERLYASRFLGDRGYLVTFRVTDPLYVLDFSDPYQPQVLGELEIAGYSDYLHPLSENFLLGLGKDAIADENAERGAWYQGVKLSLFDISRPQTPVEVDSFVIGKRGTSSAALYDHHAFSWLQRSDSEATLALPIQLHETEPENSYYKDDDPQKYYSFTHHALYVFDIGQEQIQLRGKLIATDSQAYSSMNDRGIIQGQSVHYLHDGQLYSAAIDQLQP